MRQVNPPRRAEYPTPRRAEYPTTCHTEYPTPRHAEPQAKHPFETLRFAQGDREGFKTVPLSCCTPSLLCYPLLSR